MSARADRPIVVTGSSMDRALDAGRGIVRLASTWVPRAFCTPGGRLKLRPDDLFPFQEGRAASTSAGSRPPCTPTTVR